MSMIDEGPSQATINYAESIDFLEESVGKSLQDIDCDLEKATQTEKRQIATLIERILKEYDTCIDHAIKTNPYTLETIKELRESRQWWLNFKKEEFKYNA